MASPPKPWERAGAGGTSTALPTPSNPTSTTTATAPSSSGVPSLPERPESLNSVATRTASNYTPYNTTANRFNNTYGSSPYGYGSYSSPYNRLGNSMYGSMYGSPYGGMGGMYGGGYGAPYGMAPMGGVGPNGEQMSLTQSLNQSTQATFQIIESIVGAFGGFAQMLESTYMATHSSFFAEQLGNLRQTLGSVLGIFAIWRWCRTLFAKLTGRPPPADASALTPSAFASFAGTPPPTHLPDGTPIPPKPSKKPFIFFLLAAVGMPYLMGKLIRALARSQQAEEERRIASNPALAYDHALQVAQQNGEPVHPSKLDFCRAKYDFTPESATQSHAQGIDLAVKKGDLVAVLSKTDPMGQPSEWWKCRSRDGRVGYLPSPYLEKVEKRAPQQAIAQGSQNGSPLGSRAHTMTESERTASMGVGEKGPKVEGKPGDVSVESFQKSMFNS
ncbi:MAG: Peroxisomal membrane protein PAS20 [Bogoriella megaspora]|nr:MAG: Peroxisomal membrane protein PAS20 [Bogoriella megaspora]